MTERKIDFYTIRTEDTVNWHFSHQLGHQNIITPYERQNYQQAIDNNNCGGLKIYSFNFRKKKVLKSRPKASNALKTIALHVALIYLF